jgi:hypothetical protein
MAALRVILGAVLGMLFFGWAGALHYLWFYEPFGPGVERAQKINSAWIAAGAVVGAIVCAVHVLVTQWNADNRAVNDPTGDTPLSDSETPGFRKFRSAWWFDVLVVLATSYVALAITGPTPSNYHIAIFGLGAGAGIALTRAIDNLATLMKSKRRA